MSLELVAVALGLRDHIIANYFYKEPTYDWGGWFGIPGPGAHFTESGRYVSPRMSGPTLCASHPGIDDQYLFASANNQVYYKVFSPTALEWSDWYTPGAFPGGMKDGPACAASPNYLMVLARAMDDGVYANVQELWTMKWLGWRFLQRYAEHTPTVVTSAYADPPMNRFDVVVRERDDLIMHTALNPKKGWGDPQSGQLWTKWYDLGMETLDVPAAARWRNRVWVVVQDVHSQIYWNELYLGKLVPDTWLGWEPLDGETMSAPSLSINYPWSYVLGQGLLDLVVIGTDGQIWHKQFMERAAASQSSWAGSAFGGLTFYGGRPGFVDSPAVSFRSDGLDAILVTGKDKCIYHTERRDSPNLPPFQWVESAGLRPAYGHGPLSMTNVDYWWIIG